MLKTILATTGLVAAIALAPTAAQAEFGAAEAGLPAVLGTCSETTIAELGHRLEGADDSGSFVRFSNGGMQISYDEVPEIGRARVGDDVRMCLTYVPQNCPKGDDRGRVYRTTNHRTGEVWEEPDSEHGCGGA